MTSEDTCGKCGTTIPKDSEFCPNCPRPKKNAALPAFLVIAVLCSSLLLLTSSVVNVVSVPVVEAETAPISVPAAQAESEIAPITDMNLAAYEAAKAYIEEQYPGPKRFSPLYQSTIEQKENVFTVTLSADDLGGATSVRSFYSVEMELNGNTWKLRKIKR